MPASTASEGFVSVGSGKTEPEMETDTAAEVGQVLDAPEGEGRKQVVQVQYNNQKQAPGGR